MAELERITVPTLDVLEVLLHASRADIEVHGWAIMKTIKRSGPTVYGVLDRLEDAGWIVGRWESQPATASTPRRRNYRLTPTGVTAARDLLAARRPEALEGRRLLPTTPGTGSLRWLGPRPQDGLR